MKSMVMNAHDIRAVLSGQKTQFRYPIKPQPPESAPSKIFADDIEEGFGFCDEDDGVYLCRYKPRDQIWVKESYCCVDGHRDETGIDADVVYYRATSDCRYFDHFSRSLVGVDSHFDQADIDICGGGWKSASAIPRWASRITLRIKEVRVQRLHEITDQDAIDEGITICNPGTVLQCWWDYMSDESRTPVSFGPTDSFCTLWEKRHGKGSWNENPWVWAVTFKHINKQGA